MKVYKYIASHTSPDGVIRTLYTGSDYSHAKRAVLNEVGSTWEQWSSVTPNGDKVHFLTKDGEAGVKGCEVWCIIFLDNDLVWD